MNNNNKESLQQKQPNTEEFEILKEEVDEIQIDNQRHSTPSVKSQKTNKNSNSSFSEIYNCDEQKLDDDSASNKQIFLNNEQKINIMDSQHFQMIRQKSEQVKSDILYIDDQDSAEQCSKDNLSLKRFNTQDLDINQVQTSSECDKDQNLGSKTVIFYHSFLDVKDEKNVLDYLVNLQDNLKGGKEFVKLYRLKNVQLALDEIIENKQPFFLFLEGQVAQKLLRQLKVSQYTYKKLQGIFIFGNNQILDQIKEEFFFDNCILNLSSSISDALENLQNYFYNKMNPFLQIHPYKDLDQYLGQKMPISSYFNRPPINFMNAHYLLNQKYQQLAKTQQKTFTIDNFQSLQENSKSKEEYAKILQDTKQYILEADSHLEFFSLESLTDQNIDQISQKYSNALKKNDEIECIQQILRIFLNNRNSRSSLYYLINTTLLSLDEILIHRLSDFIQGIRFAIQQINQIENVRQQAKKIQKINVSLYKLYDSKNQIFLEDMKENEKLVFPSFNIFYRKKEDAVKNWESKYIDSEKNKLQLYNQFKPVLLRIDITLSNYHSQSYDQTLINSIANEQSNINLISCFQMFKFKQKQNLQQEMIESEFQFTN